MKSSKQKNGYRLYAGKDNHIGYEWHELMDFINHHDEDIKKMRNLSVEQDDAVIIDISYGNGLVKSDIISNMLTLLPSTSPIYLSIRRMLDNDEIDEQDLSRLEAAVRRLRDDVKSETSNSTSLES
jgi:hypothetical protein